MTARKSDELYYQLGVSAAAARGSQGDEMAVSAINADMQGNQSEANQTIYSAAFRLEWLNEHNDARIVRQRARVLAEAANSNAVAAMDSTGLSVRKSVESYEARLVDRGTIAFRGGVLAVLVSLFSLTMTELTGFEMLHPFFAGVILIWGVAFAMMGRVALGRSAN